MIPEWPARDWRALVALVGSIAGAAVLTLLLAWIIYLFQLWVRADQLANIAYGLLAIIGAVLLTLGFAINRRSIKLTREGLEASGGDPEDCADSAVEVEIQQ
jgi:hypothetical protein